MNFFVNVEVDFFVYCWVEEYGVGICVIGICVDDVQYVYDCVVELGVWLVEVELIGLSELVILVIQGVGDMYLYFVDCWCGKYGVWGGLGDIFIYDIDFWLLDIVIVYEDWYYVGVGLVCVDYLM